MQKYVTISDSADVNANVLVDFVKALTAADWEKARSLTAPKFMSYGPATTDSSNIEAVILGWQKNHEGYSDIKMGRTVPAAFTSTAPETAGDLAFLWGVYSMTFKATGKTITFPYHLSARIENGKIRRLRNYYDKMQFIVPTGGKVVKAD